MRSYMCSYMYITYVSHGVYRQCDVHCYAFEEAEEMIYNTSSDRFVCESPATQRQHLELLSMHSEATVANGTMYVYKCKATARMLCLIRTGF